MIGKFCTKGTFWVHIHKMGTVWGGYGKLDPLFVEVSGSVHNSLCVSIVLVYLLNTLFLVSFLLAGCHFVDLSGI